MIRNCYLKDGVVGTNIMGLIWAEKPFGARSWDV